MTRPKRRLSKQDLRALGASPGLMAHRIGPEGRAELRQLTAETYGRRPFLERASLTSQTITASPRIVRTFE